MLVVQNLTPMEHRLTVLFLQSWSHMFLKHCKLISPRRLWSLNGTKHWPAVSQQKSLNLSLISKLLLTLLNSSPRCTSPPDAGTGPEEDALCLSGHTAGGDGWSKKKNNNKKHFFTKWKKKSRCIFPSFWQPVFIHSPYLDLHMCPSVALSKEWPLSLCSTAPSLRTMPGRATLPSTGD